MNSRERVKAALNHKPVDRVPFDATISIQAYNELIKYLDIGLQEKNECNIHQVVFAEPEFSKAMKLDCIYLSLSAPQNTIPFKYGVDEYTTEFGLTYKKVKYPNGIIEYQPFNAPLSGMSAEDLDNYNWPDPLDENIFIGLEERAKYIYETSDLAIFGYFGGSIFTLASLLRGMEQWMADLILDREFAEKLMKILTDYFTKLYCRALDKCGKYVEAVRIDYDDYGTQNGPLISPKMFREFVKPYARQFYHDVKEHFLKFNPDGKLMKHSCGGIYEFVEDFIDAGIDILDPIQPAAKGMDRARLGREFGGRVSFHGGIDIQHVLPEGTEEEIREEVRIAIESLSDPEGKWGYIVGPAHHIQFDTHPRNIIAMRDAVMEFGVRHQK